MWLLKQQVMDLGNFVVLKWPNIGLIGPSAELPNSRASLRRPVAIWKARLANPLADRFKATGEAGAQRHGGSQPSGLCRGWFNPPHWWTDQCKLFSGAFHDHAIVRQCPF